MRKKALVMAALLALLAAPAMVFAQDSAPADAHIEKPAQGGGEQGSGQGPVESPPVVEKKAPSILDNWPILAMLGLLVLVFVLSGRSRKKEQAKRQEMLASLKKGDRVTTIGGVIGNVLEIKGDEVLVKVDENANVKMRFQRWAIQAVGESGKTEPEKKENSK
jgi:preprotein translocase subunit YajC